MERYTSLTKERLLNFKARVNESSIIKILTFLNEDGSAHDISELGFEIPVYKSPYSRTPVFTLTEGNGLTVQGAGNNELAIEVSLIRATVQPDVYFVRLYSSEEDHTWLSGDWEFLNGKFDGVTETNDIIIYDNGGTAITIEVTGGGGSVTLASLGIVLQTAADDTPLDADTFNFWDAFDVILKKVTWSNLKATLKTYFDTIYTTTASANLAFWKVTGTTNITGPALITGTDANQIVLQNINTGSYETSMTVGSGAAELLMGTNANHYSKFRVTGSIATYALAQMYVEDDNSDYITFVSSSDHSFHLDSSFADFAGIEWLNWDENNFTDDTLTPKGYNDGAYDAIGAAAAALASAQAYADSLVVGLWDDRGNFNASVNAYPSSGGSGTAGAIKKGDTWTISVTGTLPTAQVVEVGDVVRALADTPGNTQANWAIQQNNIGYTAENSSNKTDTMAGNTTSSIKYLSAKGVFDYIFSLGYQVALTAANFGDFIVALTGKTTPVDADSIILSDSAASDDAKKVSLTNFKAFLKTYFDTLYKSITSSEFIGLACSDETTVLAAASTSIPLATFHAPYAMTLTRVYAGLRTAGTGASQCIVDIHVNGTTIMTTTKILFTASVKLSADGTLTSTSLAAGDYVEIFLDQRDTNNIATGLKTYLVGYK